jgi:regulator of sirC expression with transglutaminase-like and TPR domain
MIDRAAFAVAVRSGEDRLDLALAALLLARIHEPVPEPARYLDLLNRHAEQVRLRLSPTAGPEQTVEALSEYLAGEQSFVGNTRHYSDPRNSCLNHVLDRRTGIPITLAVVYLEVGWRLGLPLAGVGLPGHFLVKYVGDEEVLFDPFHGGVVVTADDCAQRLREIFGRPVRLEPHYLAAVTRKQIIARMLANLARIYLHMLDYPRALEVVEHQLLLSPWSLDHIRDRGLIQLQLGHTDAAITDFETYLQFAADADDAPQVQQRLAALKRKT